MPDCVSSSGTANCPFDALVDHPAGGATPIASQLWRLHQERRRASIGRLRLSPPRPDLPRRDPRALRLLVLIALALGLVIAGPRAGRLIVASLSPSFAAANAPLPVEAWIKPPAYTGLATIILKAGDEQSVAVPTGSTLEAHVSSGSRTPRLDLGDVREDFKAAAGGGFIAQHVINAAGTLKIRRGWSTLAEWNITVIPDHPPVVAFVDPPTAMDSGALKIGYLATDDYGVVSVGIKMRLETDRPDIVAEPIDVLLASGLSDKEARGSSYQDLTAHPWAGMKVRAKLVATDGAGQTGESTEASFILPERTFASRVAQAIVAERKHVILNDAPRFQIVGGLSILLSHPEAFRNNYAVFLALDTAAMELRQSRPDDREAVMRIEDLLWNAALKIEDGDRPEAEKDLRAAEEELDRALKDPNTPASEIARLTEKLKDAMNRDIEAMAQNMQQRMAEGEQQQPQDPNAKVMDRDELNSQIDKMKQLAQEGSRDAAKDMLDYIKSLLENMKAQQQGSSQASEQGRKAMDKLKDLAKKQRDLENNNSANAADQQEALRQSLGDAARDIGEAMGEIPKSMSAADKAMRDAARALKRGVKGGATSNQEEAAGKLDDAVQAMADQMSQADSEAKGDGKGDRDPLGRNRGDFGKNVRVPTDREMQHSRDILNELRRRASERERPRIELDYLRRLLQQY
jgi:uncharacterized protein (TIGR02302 family)